MRPGLSKSKLTAFAQCPRRLWLQVHRPDLATTNAAREERLAGGDRVGAEACRQCPGGVMVHARPNLAAAVATTRALIEGGHEAPIFEATFEHDGVLVRCDVLTPDGAGGWHMAEVKSSTKAKDEHRGDLATQLWVARGAGVTVSSAAIRHLDRSFVLEREGDFTGVFADTDLSADLDAELAAVPALIADARVMLAGPVPDAIPGDQCTAPYDCEFTAHCHAQLPPGPEWPVTLLPNGSGRKWRAAGIIDLLALDNADLTGNARRVHAATVSGRVEHDPIGAAAAMAGWAYPRTWLDFETIALPLPRWVGTRPYDQVPFQFTAIVEDGQGGEAMREFLQLDGSDPRRACAEALASLPKEGAVIAYSAAFEAGVLRGLAAAFPDLAPALESLAARLVDLLPVTRAHWYHRDQRGSWSIKKVLPTIAPTMNYEALEVKHGGEAQEAFLEAIALDCAPDRRTALDSALRVYCGQDVEAMRIIARALLVQDGF